MAKATLTLPNGTRISIDGTAEEVARLINFYSEAVKHQPDKKTSASAKPASRTKAPGKKVSSAKTGPQSYILELKGSGFFKKKQSLGDVQKQLEAEGHIYAQTSLSAPLLRLVRAHELKRIRENDAWLYVDY